SWFRPLFAARPAAPAWGRRLQRPVRGRRCSRSTPGWVRTTAWASATVGYARPPPRPPPGLERAEELGGGVGPPAGAGGWHRGGWAPAQGQPAEGLGAWYTLCHGGGTGGEVARARPRPATLPKPPIFSARAWGRRHPVQCHRGYPTGGNPARPEY